MYAFFVDKIWILPYNGYMVINYKKERGVKQ